MSGWWLASYLVLWGMVLVCLLVLLVVLRQLGLIYLRSQNEGGLRLDEGPAVGSILPPFREIDDWTGKQVLFPDPAAGCSLLLFASPGCDICKDSVRGLRTAIRGRDVSAVVVSEGEREENRELHKLVSGHAPFIVSLDRQRALRVQTIPYGIVVSRTGVVLEKGIINSIVDLEDLLDRADEQARLVSEAIPA